jgi:tight adherence protein C
VTARVVLPWAWAALVVWWRVRQRRGVPARVRAVRVTRTPVWGGRRAAMVTLAVSAGLAWSVAPALALAVSGAAVVRPRLHARRRERRRQAAVAADLPEVVDLLRMCVGGGLTVGLAVQAVARRADGPVGRALEAAVQDTARGRRLADALEEVPNHLGDVTRPLIAVLVGSERYGHAIGPALERLAAECRDDQRRQAEAAARRVPVLLLFPLVTCILPAFALLTVGPLIAGALRALRL